MSSVLTLQGLAHRYNEDWIYRDLNLEVAQGEWIALLGASGCGKTTLLRSIAGLIAPSDGKIILAGEDITTAPPSKRGIGLVFQDYALFPNHTVAQNIAFGRKSTAPSVKELLSIIGLSNFEHRRPSQLSGGQQQRVALARALAAQPKLLLLDEPFANIDAFKKESLMQELKSILKGVSVIFVTHDRSDAMAMADRLAVFDGGSLAQIQSPEDLYQFPRSRSIAELTGSCNFLTIHNKNQEATSIFGSCTLVHAMTTQEAIALARPSSFAIQPEEKGDSQIMARHYVGGLFRYRIVKEEVEIMVESHTRIEVGRRVQVIQKQPLWIIPGG